MKLYVLSQLAILIAPSLVLSIPTSPPASTIGGSLGDGYYRVSNVNNITNLVNFIPLAEIPHLKVIKGNANASTPLGKKDLEARALQKRGYATCTSWTLNADDTLNAQACLRNAAQSELEWKTNHWAFVSIPCIGQPLDLLLITLLYSAKLVGRWHTVVLIRTTLFAPLSLIIWSLG
jgi:hypothetical protein